MSGTDFRIMSKIWIRNNLSSWVQTETQIKPSSIKYSINVTWVICYNKWTTPYENTNEKIILLGRKGLHERLMEQLTLDWAWEDTGVHHGEEGKEYTSRKNCMQRDEGVEAQSMYRNTALPGMARIFLKGNKRGSKWG